MDAIAFAAGEDANFLLLVCTLKIKGGTIGAGIDLTLPKFKRICALRDFFVDSFLRVKRARLVGIGKLDRFTYLDGTAVGFFLADNHPNQSRFARAVRTDDPDDGTRGNGSKKGVEDEAVVKRFGQIVKLEYDIPKPRTGRDVNFQVFAARFGFLVQ